MAGVALKCQEPGWNSNGEGSSLALTDTEGRNLGERPGLETPLAPADNDAHYAPGYPLGMLHTEWCDQGATGNPLSEPPG